MASKSDLLIANEQKALTAMHAAMQAAKYAGTLAVSMAQESNLSSNLANQAQANLERYVYGSSSMISAVPPNINMESPQLMNPPKEIMNASMGEEGLILVTVLLISILLWKLILW